MQEPTRIPAATVQTLLTQLVAGPLSPAKVERAQMSTLNWLINQAVVSFGPQGYKLYSPLFAEFIAPRLQPAQEQAPRPVTPGTPLEDLPIYTELTKTEEALLRYFRAWPTPSSRRSNCWPTYGTGPTPRPGVRPGSHPPPAPATGRSPPARGQH
ncbi:MAG: hypothetical protein R3A10_00990 [Caldilineaceae bacterium]